MSPKLLILCTALAASYPALAVQVSTPSPNDPRVRFVNYDPYNVVPLYGKIGTETLVIFDKDEIITDMNAGDIGAWGVGATKSGNSFSIKPGAVLPDTNMHVVTNKRSYSFDLKLAAAKGQVNYLTVFYRYPTEEQMRRLEEAARRAPRDELNGVARPDVPAIKPQVAGKRAGVAKYRLVQVSDTDAAAPDMVPAPAPRQYQMPEDAPGVTVNRSYTMQGASDIAPNAAWDDGRTTFFRFPSHHTAPAVYMVDESGQEHFVNWNAEPDGQITIHAVARKFVLRQGNLVTCIYNEFYFPTGLPAATNTSSPNVERVLKQPGAQ